jgi:hypothetical protein
VRQDLSARGERYDKSKLERFQPPKLCTRQKKKLLLYVNVNITPTKTGKVGIYEGDDLAQIAKTFCRSFSLN